MTETLERFFARLSAVLERPAMYGVQKVEDINLFFTYEIVFNQNLEIQDWSTNFNYYVAKDSVNALEGFDWCKIIRLYSGSDAHSLELFKELYKKSISNPL